MNGRASQRGEAASKPREHRGAGVRRRGGDGAGPRRRIDFDLWFPLAYAALYLFALLVVQRRYFPIGDTGVETDFYGDMAVAARELWRGNFSVSQYPYKGPVYSFVLVLFYALVGDWYRGGVLLSAVFTAAGIVVLYRLVRGVFNRPVAAVTVVSVSLVFEFFLVAHKASTDMLFFFLCVVVMERIITDRLSAARVCAAAIASACAFLTRYNGIVLPAGVLGTVLFFNPARLPAKRRLVLAAAYLLLFLAVCMPWFIMNYAATGEILPTRNIENIARDFYGDGDRPGEGFSSLHEAVRRDTARFVSHYLANVPAHFWRDMNGTLGIEAGALVMLGFLALFVAAPSRRQSSFLLFAALYFLLLGLVFHLRRFSIPLLPAYYAVAWSLFVGSGATGRTRLGSRLERLFDAPLHRLRGMWKMKLAREGGGGAADRRREGGLRLRTVGGLLTLAVVATLVVLQVVRIVRHERMYHRRRPLFVEPVAQFLRQPAMKIRDGAEAVLMARKPHVAFYAGMTYRQYPETIRSMNQFLSFAVERGVDYIVYSVIEQEHYPEAYFLGRLDATPGVERIYEADQALVYRMADWLDLGTAAGRSVLEEYETALRSADNAGDVDKILGSCYSIASLYGMNGDWGKKIEYCTRALRTAAALPDSSSRLTSSALFRINAAEAHLLAGSSGEGIAALDSIMPWLDRGGPVAYRTGAHSILSMLCEELGRFDEARRHLAIVHEIYASEGNSERAEDARKAMEALDETERRRTGGGESR